MAAIFKPYRVSKAKLDSLEIKDGQFICLDDEQEIYLDLETQRVQLLSHITNEQIDIICNALETSLMSERE